ncbi:hypothetical protein Tco_0353163 [Tanacetum coccineum]
MHADLKYVESLEDELDELESDKAEFSNMYDMLLQECVSKDVMCSYLQSSSDLDEITELQCLYLHKVRECDYWRSDISEIYMVLLVSCWRTKLLTGNSGTDLYNFLQEYIVHQLPICSHGKAYQLMHGYGIKDFLIHTSTYINLFQRNDVVIGLPKLKYIKDQLCSSCEMSKEK